jgi:hypothetical protein
MKTGTPEVVKIPGLEFLPPLASLPLSSEFTRELFDVLLNGLKVHRYLASTMLIGRSATNSKAFCCRLVRQAAEHPPPRNPSAIIPVSRRRAIAS